MHFSQRILIAAIATMAIVTSAAAAGAHGFNGNTMDTSDPAMHNYSGAYPVTISGSQRSNGTGCLTLNQGGSDAGSASLVFGSRRYQYGSFVVMNDILMVTISQPLYGQNGALMFVSHARRGHIGQGNFEDIEGGSNFDFGAVTYGTKNGC